MEQALINSILRSSSSQAWETILSEMWGQFSPPMSKGKADALTTERDRNAGELDTLLAGAAWDLWNEVPTSPHKTSDHLKNFWEQESQGKAILILDALSLREACWILQEAEARGFAINKQQATLSEVPGDTTPFAKALGFGQRSALVDNGGKSSSFPGAVTESVDMPFADCTSLIKPDPAIIFWHHWPDCAMHDLDMDGNGGQKLTRTATETLTSDDFWKFIEKLSTGRKLVITGDHGYAQSGLFRDIHDKEQSEYMKKTFKSGRATNTTEDTVHNWVPPLTLDMQGSKLALGRRKWKSQGGYPTLTHGGLSLLEVAVPFIELEKIG